MHVCEDVPHHCAKARECVRVCKRLFLFMCVPWRVNALFGEDIFDVAISITATYVCDACTVSVRYSRA